MDPAPRPLSVEAEADGAPDTRSGARPDTEQRVAGSLAPFESVTLAELDAVALLDRYDTKYLIGTAHVPPLLLELCHDYRVLEIDGRRQHQYRTLYFDTPNFALYRRHHAGEPVRHKIRSRQYLDSGQSYFEVKRRDARGRMSKARLRTDEPVTALTPAARALLAANVAVDQQVVEAKVRTSFVRITLAGRRTAERVTLDLGTRFSYEGHSLILQGVVIAEVKRSRPDAASPFVQRMADRAVGQISVSKYCLGVAMLVPGIEHDAFDATLRTIAALSVPDA